ncbi:hypothetical protein [Streptomyces sp. NBC_01304]|uniref:hypothetical protein n=1 Tax=Streptomyces sp. NBC_01304 TaxID=2903818 RepID=UPI002E110EE4|nr:hypothetical protein OG430_42375 [Streptomyces sp. NBC_01304]
MNVERRRLRRAADEGFVARVWRAELVPDDHLHGFVLATNRDWTLLLLVTDSMLDGYSLVRTRDVTGVRTRGKRDLHRRWMKKHGTWPPPAPPGERLVLGSTRSLLGQVGSRHNLVGVLMEDMDPDLALIGKVACLGKKSVRLQEIDNTAHWDRTTSKVRYEDVTRIDFADHYTRVLADLGGIPPSFA